MALSLSNDAGPAVLVTPPTPLPNPCYRGIERCQFTRNSLPATKSEKHGSLIFTSGSTDFTNSSGTLTIMGTRSFAVYDVEEFPADHGRGFMMFKKTPGTDVTEDRYACFIGSDDVSLCECKGFTRYGKCKHLQSLFELVKANKI